MTTALLTPERIEQAANICRWRGRVRRHYSVLEHTVIGAFVLRELGYDHNAVRSFLLHDLEETEFVGDVPTPDKAIYMNADYFRDVRLWDEALYRETEVKRNTAVVEMMDECMMQAEYATVSLVPDESPRTDRTIRMCRVLIDDDEFGTPGQWWQLWDNCAPALKLDGVV
jgi:hypothetical protein